MMAMTRPRLFAFGTVAVVLAIFIGANAHLVAVAFTSKPDCVLQPDREGVATYRAAKISC